VIVFDLKCQDRQHVFEAWFGSSDAYEDQRARHLIGCPFCGDTVIEKALMAPNVSVKSNKSSSGARDLSPSVDVPSPTEIKATLSSLAKVQSAALETSTWVGSNFDSRARAMDAGEVPHASIHGQVTREEAKALIEDGISIMPLLFPVIPPDHRN
jgi:hypothetical protein